MLEIPPLDFGGERDALVRRPYLTVPGAEGALLPAQGFYAFLRRRCP